VAHDDVDNTVFGYLYDGGFMAPTGIPSRKIGTPTTPPGDYSLGLGQLPYIWIQPPDPSFDPLTFNFNSDLDRLNKDSVLVTYSTSLDINKFTRRGGKIIWYHGLSDPGPPVLGTIRYYTQMAQQNDGLRSARKFSRLYLIPNMGHCAGGPATDQFDLLSPLVSWVEQGAAPDPIVASGPNFTSPPTTRSRPLCPYPEQARYIGSPGGDLGTAANYKCTEPPHHEFLDSGEPDDQRK
jgi:feruloyl esterase